MKNLNKLIASAIILAGFASKASAQTNSATANASARIVSAITIQNNSRHLNFGSISPGASGGTVTIAAVDGGTRSIDGTNLRVTNAASSSAKFTVTGDGSATYAITRVPAANTNLTLTSTTDNTKTMAAALVVSTATGNGVETTTGQLSGTSGTDGEQLIFVGGTLTVGPAQASGLYQNNGGITLTVNYN